MRRLLREVQGASDSQPTEFVQPSALVDCLGTTETEPVLECRKLWQAHPVCTPGGTN